MILSYALSWTPSPLASLPNWQRLPHGINFAIVELNHRSALARFRLVSKSWTAAGMSTACGRADGQSTRTNSGGGILMCSEDL